MKKLTFLLVSAIAFLLVSCTANMTPKTDQLYGNTWELEYITGPRITFEGLFPDKKPEIMFNKADMRVSGNSSCNGYSTKYTLAGNQISFADPEISTMMYCGDGEVTFLSTMKKINKYSIDENGKLVLMMDDIPMMRFKKSMTK